MLAEEHNEPETNGADALQADDASVGNAADTDAHLAIMCFRWSDLKINQF